MYKCGVIGYGYFLENPTKINPYEIIYNSNYDYELDEYSKECFYKEAKSKIINKKGFDFCIICKITKIK